MDNNDVTEKKISIDDILASGYASYSDGDIIVLDNIGNSPMEGCVKLDMIMMVYCTRGRLQCDSIGHTHTANVGDVLICLPNIAMDNFMISPDFESKIVGVSFKAAQRNIQINRDHFDLMSYVATNPVISLDEERQELFLKYYSIILHKIKSPHGYFHKQIMHSILQCTIYELFAIISPHVDFSNEGGNLKQANLIFRKFLSLLAKNDGRIMSVKKYAEDLCITPKYLSSVSKTVSGRTALDLIHESTIKSIEHYLKRSNLSIKEISEQLGFPNLSFFGKFTKNHLGMSPTQYRKSQSLKNT